MTYAEAIKELKQIPSHIGGDCDGYELRAISIAIEAIDKQIPKKPTHEATLYHSCTCPTCKNVIDEFTNFKGEKVRIITNWCKFCGQALDWSDTE